MNMSEQQLSRDAYERLKAEYEDLSTRGRIEVAEEIELARAEGDLKENAGYHAAKDKQGHMEGRTRQLEHLLENAVVVEGARQVFTMIYDGDDADMAERFVIGRAFVCIALAVVPSDLRHRPRIRLHCSCP